MKSFKNILIIRTDRIGDVVLTTPVIKALRKNFPMARLSILINPGTKDLVQGNPYLDEILFDNRAARHRGILGFLRLARDLCKKRFDAVFIFHTKCRYNLVAYLAGIPVRIGYKNDKWGFFLTDPVKDIRTLGHKHEAEYCLDLLKECGIHSEELDFFIPTQKDAEAWAHQWLLSHGLYAMDVVAIHAGSSDPAKCWPAERFAKLIDSLHQTYFLKAVLIGSAGTQKFNHKIMSLTQHKPLDLTGQVSLSCTASLLRRCRLLVSNDSGPVHIAAAVGIPVISLFMRDSPGINPERWRPFSEKGVYIYSNKGIQVQEVLDVVEEIFHKDSQEFFHW